MVIETHSPKTSFVARIWMEPNETGEQKWRGQINHVQTGQREYFEDLAAMRRFIEIVSNAQGPKSGLASGLGSPTPARGAM